MSRGYSLGTKFNILLAAVFVVGMALTWGIVSWISARQAQNEISSKAELLLQTMQGVRRYTSDDLNHYLLSLQDGDKTFLPETVPAFSARSVFEKFRTAGYDQFFYKEAGTNPTNVKDDKADAFEEGILGAFRQDPKLKSLSGYREDFGGERRFYTAEPLRLTDESCLRCHSTPDAAPAAMIKRYGPQNGFGWQLGDVIATRIVYVPAGHVAGIAEHSALLVTGLYALVFAAGIAAINLLLKSGVIRPINQVATAAEVISSPREVSADDSFSQSDAAKALEKARGRGDEVGLLADRFLIMAGQVQKREKSLQQAKAAVQQREAYFRALIENASVAYLILDDRYMIRYANPLVAKLLGVATEELTGKMMIRLVPDDGQRALFEAVERAEQTRGTSEPFTFKRVLPQGETRWIEAVVTNLLDQPTIKGLVVVLRDVTERKTLEELKEQSAASMLTASISRPALSAPAEVPAIAHTAPVAVQEPFGAQRVDLTPDQLARRLVKLFPDLPLEKQQQIVLQLMAAGIAASMQSTPKSLPMQSVQHLKSKLQIPAADEVDPGRLVELTVMLAEFAAGLDTLVWSTWKTLAPQSEIRRNSSGSAAGAPKPALRKTIADYIGAEGTTPKGEVAHDLERTRTLLAALIASLGQVSQEFAKRYREKFSPLEIESRASSLPGFFGGKDAKCWRAYKDLSNTMSPEAMEAEVLEGLTRYAESLMTSLR